MKNKYIEIASKFFEFELSLSECKNIDYKEYKGIEDERYRFLKSLILENDQDENCDLIHDYILSENDGLIEKPEGYEIRIVGSFYATYYRCYKTVSLVMSPSGKYYYVIVNTINQFNYGKLN